MNFEFDLLLKVTEISEEAGFPISFVRGASAEMADFIINISDDEMLGLKVNPVLAQKPLSIFPQNDPISLEELKIMLSEVRSHA